MSSQLEHDLGYLLARTHRIMRRALMARLEPMGITYPQFQVLNALCEEDAVSQTALAQRVNMNTSVLARILDRMEKAHLIERVEDPDDSRVKRVTVTTHGCSLQAEFVPQRNDALQQAREGLTDKEVLELERLLNAVYDRMKPLVDEDPSIPKEEVQT